MMMGKTTALGALGIVTFGACVQIPHDPGPEDVPGVEVPFATIDVGSYWNVGAGDLLEFELQELDGTVPVVIWSVGDIALRFEEISVQPPVTLTGDLPPLDLAVETGAHLEADLVAAGAGDYELRVFTNDYDLPEVDVTIRALE